MWQDYCQWKGAHDLVRDGTVSGAYFFEDETAKFYRKTLRFTETSKNSCDFGRKSGQNTRGTEIAQNRLESAAGLWTSVSTFCLDHILQWVAFPSLKWWQLLSSQHSTVVTIPQINLHLIKSSQITACFVVLGVVWKLTWLVLILEWSFLSIALPGNVGDV